MASLGIKRGGNTGRCLACGKTTRIAYYSNLCSDCRKTHTHTWTPDTADHDVCSVCKSIRKHQEVK